ncbi:MAG: thermonuclease family protein [Candidatus Omnitrophica bacterium]|nr:thermonuclease family protein [Candidatus Omnitrophota bacterium]
MKKSLSLCVLLVFLMVIPVRAELNPLLQASARREQVLVERVLTVDMLILAGGEKVSLIGIEGPNPPKMRDVKRDANGFIIPDEDPTTPFEVEALRFVKSLAEGQLVRLVFDVERRSSDGILQAYVILPDGKILNEEALRFGYAQLRLRMPNMKYAERFRQAYREARKEMRGMQGNW